MNEINNLKLNRKAVSVSSLHEAGDETAYWLTKTPAERWAATELMRQIAYGYDPATTRLQRVLEITELKPD